MTLDKTNYRSTIITIKDVKSMSIFKNIGILDNVLFKA